LHIPKCQPYSKRGCGIGINISVCHYPHFMGSHTSDFTARWDVECLRLVRSWRWICTTVELLLYSVLSLSNMILYLFFPFSGVANILMECSPYKLRTTAPLQYFSLVMFMNKSDWMIRSVIDWIWMLVSRAIIHFDPLWMFFGSHSLIRKQSCHISWISYVICIFCEE